MTNPTSHPYNCEYAISDSRGLKLKCTHPNKRRSYCHHSIDAGVCPVGCIMTPARQPHPQRCETCEHFDDDSRKRYCSCKKFDRWMDGEDIAFVEAIGCASHSRATHTSPRVSVLVDPAGDCDTCRFVKECSPLYLPPCYNGGEIRAAKDAREQDIEALESLCSTRKSRYEDPDEPEERREFLRGVSEGVQMARRVVKSLCAQHREQEQHND